MYLNDPNSVAELHFTKSNDDWLNEITAAKSYHGVREYAREGEQIPGNSAPSLKEMLDFRGFAPSKTTLYVTGVQTNRCVMKGSIHAKNHGFDVALIQSGTAGNPDDDNWHTSGPKPNAPGLCPGCNEPQLQSWRREIYDGMYHGGPNTPLSIQYMQNAGVRVLRDENEVARTIY